MSVKNILGGALVAAVAATAVAPIASAATINVVPAAYAEGLVTAVDAEANTITVNNQTYTLRSPLDGFDGVTAGSEVNIAYVVQNGKRVILAITPVAEETDEAVE